MRAIVLWGAVCLVGACAVESEQPTACDASLDADADGLDDCAEEELGTAKDAADSDGDGFSDGEEVECVSDPLNVDESCYACGWAHNDPGDLGRAGSDVGDTLRNLTMPDQCGDRVDLHDFAGAYHILFMTTQWCTACLDEASDLRQRTIDFEEESGLPFSYMIALFQDSGGGPPDADVADDYADVVDAKKRIPVLADKKQALLDDTPYDGKSLPGKCVLSDDMVLLDCYVGEGDDEEAFDLIRDHAGI